MQQLQSAAHIKNKSESQRSTALELCFLRPRGLIIVIIVIIVIIRFFSKYYHYY